MNLFAELRPRLEYLSGYYDDTTGENYKCFFVVEF